MDWNNDHAREEYAWLSLMARLKFDFYEDFSAGARFLERLAGWLQQFALKDRETAYQFVRHNLLFISKAQVRHLIELVYPEFVRPFLEQAVAQKLNIRPYQVWAHAEALKQFRELSRKTLFFGLSDGARMDDFRRANFGRINNEQVVLATQINAEKWDSLLQKLRRDCDDPEACFRFVYLLDDFVGSGKTLLRLEDSGLWDGRLKRFWDDVQSRLHTHFEDNLTVCVHHYIATAQAAHTLPQAHSQALAAKEKNQWFRDARFTYSSVLPASLPLPKTQSCTEFSRLVESDAYYDPGIETDHTAVGGADVRMGFSKCALPLVLEHNTPNNSIALLWAESSGENGRHAMRPLFRRRQRHI